MNNALSFSTGFEVEFALNNPRQLHNIATALEAEGLRVDCHERYRRSPVSSEVWDLKTDSSCGVRPGVQGYEAASPVISTYENLVKHAKVGAVIQQHGGVINPRCGLHVHMGVSSAPGWGRAASDRLVKFLNRYEQAFYLLVPEARRSNFYCKPIPADFVNRYRRGSGLVDVWRDKNTWVNFVTLSRIGTAEFRLFPGTLDPSEVVGATMFLQQVLDCVIHNGKEVNWGKASAKDNRMLFYTMLQQAGFYDSKFDPDRLKLARKWATTRFRHENRAPAPALAVNADSTAGSTSGATYRVDWLNDVTTTNDITTTTP